MAATTPKIMMMVIRVMKTVIAVAVKLKVA
jgi:hypothetical protein